MSSWDKEAYWDYLYSKYEEECEIYNPSLYEEIINFETIEELDGK